MNCGGCGVPIPGTWWACMWCPGIYDHPCFWRHSKLVDHGAGD